jgi:hypothetical protein
MKSVLGRGIYEETSSATEGGVIIDEELDEIALFLEQKLCYHKYCVKCEDECGEQRCPAKRCWDFLNSWVLSGSDDGYRGKIEEWVVRKHREIFVSSGRFK